MNSNWEYNVRSISNQISNEDEISLLNEQGSKGWELVSVFIVPAPIGGLGGATLFYFKRKYSSST